METIKLSVAGMTCNHCVMHVGNALKELDGVADVRVDLAGKSADVTYDESKVDKATMAAAVKEAGYSVLD